MAKPFQWHGQNQFLSDQFIARQAHVSEQIDARRLVEQAQRNVRYLDRRLDFFSVRENIFTSPEFQTLIHIFIYFCSPNENQLHCMQYSFLLATILAFHG